MQTLGDPSGLKGERRERKNDEREGTTGSYWWQSWPIHQSQMQYCCEAQGLLVSIVIRAETKLCLFVLQRNSV